VKVSKDEVVGMLEKLLEEAEMVSWKRKTSTLLEAADVMNRMYAYGTKKTVAFNLEDALNGAEVQTRDGRKVTGIKVVSDDCKSMYAHEPKPIQGLMASIHNDLGIMEFPFYKDGGAHLYLGENSADLFMVG